MHGITKYLVLSLFLGALPRALAEEKTEADKPSPGGKVSSVAEKAQETYEPPDGEDASRIQVANLIYAGVHSSVCFSDHFLRKAETDSSIATSRQFHAVKSSSPLLFKHPFVVMTGEGEFKLQEEERANLKKYLEDGGFLLASAGCSSPEWDRSFRVELGRMFPEAPLRALPMSHKIFKTVYEIKQIETRHGKPKALEGLELNGHLAVVYSSDGLNDTGHVHGCCCCGGNEIVNCSEINVNILAYALVE